MTLRTSRRRRAFKAALAVQGKTAMQVLHDLGISRTWLNAVLDGEGRSTRIESYIGEHFPEVIEAAPWPSREAEG